MGIVHAVRRVGGKPPAMRRIVKAFRRPPTGRVDDRDGGGRRLSDGVARASRCPASLRHALLAENLGKPSPWVIIIAPWYQSAPTPRSLGYDVEHHLGGAPAGASPPLAERAERRADGLNLRIARRRIN